MYRQTGPDSTSGILPVFQEGLRMYKVVIVDDEPIIVEGLTKLLPWEKYGCTVASTAYNGNEGLEAVRREKPEILFTDIAMPGLDGLAMIAALRSEFPEMQISILTGYRDFDFCRQALKLGVVRFLLKPSNMEELEEALREMAQRCGKMAGPGDETEAADSASGFIVRNALAYMEEHYTEKLTLNSVADKIYVSQWHLSKLLNKQEGKTFSEILNGIRVVKAKELLRDPALRIADIAEMVGFLDVAHFSRVFKKITGVSANEYRNKMG